MKKILSFIGAISLASIAPSCVVSCDPGVDRTTVFSTENGVLSKKLKSVDVNKVNNAYELTNDIYTTIFKTTDSTSLDGEAKTKDTYTISLKNPKEDNAILLDKSFDITKLGDVANIKTSGQRFFIKVNYEKVYTESEDSAQSVSVAKEWASYSIINGKE